MLTLYFAQDKINEIPNDPNLLDNLIHASFVRTLNLEEITDAIITQADADLQKISAFPSIDLDDFIPEGNPFLADAGHNGYTWEKKRRRYEFDDFAKLNGDYLLSPAFIGSSSAVYLPVLPVAKREKQNTEFSESLPKFMIYDHKNIVEAIYDIRTAKFVHLDNGKVIDPNGLKLLSPAKQRSKYLKYQASMKIKHHFKNEGTYLGGTFFIPSSFVNGVKHFAREIAFLGMDLNSFEKQIFHHFSLRGRFLRSFTDGDRCDSWINSEQVNSFSYANYLEIKQAVKILKWCPDRINPLNRYLLAKALEQKEGNFLVGNIQGDSYTIHLPYVPVDTFKQ